MGSIRLISDPYHITVPVTVDNPYIAGLLMNESFQWCFPVGVYFPDKDTLYKQNNRLDVRYKVWANKTHRTDMACACVKRVHSMHIF